MHPLQNKDGTIHRLHLLGRMLWYPFHTCFVECVALPMNGLLRNETNSISTPPNTVDSHCSHESSWTDTSLFDHRDCIAAIRYMMFTEMSDPFHGSKPREFLTQQAPSSGHLGQPLVTPRKYVTRESMRLPNAHLQFSHLPSIVSCRAESKSSLSESCTLAIIMRSDIHKGDLPHEEAHSSIASDVSSFRAINEAADVVFFACAKKLHGSGWAEVGEFYDCDHTCPLGAVVAD